jgi:hypothetical protein
MEQAMMKPASCLLGAVLGALALVGCGASMSEQTCRTTSWYAQGVDDGTRGRPNAVLEDYTSDCAEHRITPDRNAWFWGHAKGLVTFCADGPGYDVGNFGVEYRGSCAGRPGEVQFLLGLSRGLSHRYQGSVVELRDLNDRIASAVVRADADEMQPRAIVLRIDLQRSEALMLWIEARLRALGGMAP